MSVGVILTGSAALLRLDPAQLTANTNNWSIAVSRAGAVFVDTDASRNLTGIVAVTGASFYLVNDGSFDLVLKHQDANSTSANQFICATGADITLSANKVATIFYDSTATRWRVM